MTQAGKGGPGVKIFIFDGEEQKIDGEGRNISFVSNIILSATFGNFMIHSKHKIIQSCQRMLYDTSLRNALFSFSKWGIEIVLES